MNNNELKKSSSGSIRWTLVFFDLIVFAFTCWFILGFYRGGESLGLKTIMIQSLFYGILSFVSRFVFKVYSQVWRYGGIQSYIKLLVSDGIAFVFYYFIEVFTFNEYSIRFSRCLSLACVNLLIALGMRMVYRYAYKFGNEPGFMGALLRFLLKVFTLGSIKPLAAPDSQKIKVAIIGAGSLGINLAEDLLQSTVSSYTPVCFIDTDSEKIGREIHNLPVLSESDATLVELDNHGIQEVIFAFPAGENEKRKRLYEYYSHAGYKIKVYDNPRVENAEAGRRKLREFEPEELLFRKPLDVINDKTRSYYRDKVVLITGGGGSIGSELCRQIMKMDPEKLIILDIYENGAYDIQQELRILYPEKKNILIEIVSVYNYKGLERVFREYRPQIVLNAAAHKHVPLMEKNCIEAVENNVFGTLNTVELSIKYNAERVIMVSTDKAVNPTNIMGATKRMCEMIVQAYSANAGKTTFSTTRFGNVLGSAGSVIPLFKKQIAIGGPVTLTDRRIIRYFMTIPEAAQLVLTSGAMAKNGELFVLDMGQPVKILDLAKNMIKLSGMEPETDIKIVETGLRPGEKLYEELLVKTEELDKTENELIFVERDTPITMDELSQKLDILRKAVETDSDEEVRKAIAQVIPTYMPSEEVNARAIYAEEMKNARKM
ncbi:MAG: polysaccharide biosynthesis protein [Clostridia bacterium]|nr:polysaccharide biosynthesis protein [Clostridia bacterium]